MPMLPPVKVLPFPIAPGQGELQLVGYEETSKGRVYGFAFDLAEDDISDLRIFLDMTGIRKLPRFVSACISLADPYTGADTVNFSIYTHPLEIIPTDFEIEKLPVTERGLTAGYAPITMQAIPYAELERYIVVKVASKTGYLANPTSFVGWISLIN